MKVNPNKCVYKQFHMRKLRKEQFINNFINIFCRHNFLLLLFAILSWKFPENNLNMLYLSLTHSLFLRLFLYTLIFDRHMHFTLKGSWIKSMIHAKNFFLDFVLFGSFF